MNDSPIKEITLSAIKKMIDEHGVSKSRQLFSSQIGTSVKVGGTILKLIRRNENLKLLIQAEMKVFAEFLPTMSEKSFRKGEKVELVGHLQSVGSEAVCLDKCRAKENNQVKLLRK